MTANFNPQFWWWVARATGIVAWAMAAAAIAWGLLLSGRLMRRRRLPAWLLDLHRYLGTLTIAFVAVHLGALVADNWTHFGARELFVPMASTWRPRAVTWGIIAFYGLVIIQVTSWGMRRLPRKVWHGIHLTSYLVFVTATVHAALAGADRMNPLVQALGVVGVTVVFVLTVLRIVARREEPARERMRVPAAATAPVVAPTAALSFPPPKLADRIPEPDVERAARLARLGSRVTSRSGTG